VSFDLLVLSPHADDAAFAASGRIARAARSGQKVALLTVCRSESWRAFGEGGVRAVEDLVWCESLGLHLLPPFLDDAPLRDRRYRTGRRLTEWIERDHDEVVKLVDYLTTIDAKTILAPLGVGEHVDHQIVHWAARSRPQHNVEYYEDMPYSAMAGHVEARLANLGHAVTERPPVRAGMRAWAATPLIAKLPALARPFVSWTLARSLRRRFTPAPLTLASRHEPIDRADRLAAIACYPTQWPLFYASLEDWSAQLTDYERVWTISE
jgi:LmbE family N-acetylglucosaminyl deacetylase